jgi:hypothetical protein
MKQTVMATGASLVDKRIFLDDNSRRNISQDEIEEKPRYCDVDHISWDCLGCPETKKW